MSGAKGKSDDQGADIDDLIKSAGKLLDSWKKSIEDIAKYLDKAGVGKDTKGGGGGGGGGKDDGGGAKGGKGGQDGFKKWQEQAKKDADEANKKLSDDLEKMMKGQKPPSDQKDGSKLPEFLEKRIGKDGLILKDFAKVKPDVDIDTKKMQVKKVGATVTWDWK